MEVFERSNKGRYFYRCSHDNFVKVFVIYDITSTQLVSPTKYLVLLQKTGNDRYTYIKKILRKLFYM